jgi:hypothetical protein
MENFHGNQNLCGLWPNLSAASQSPKSNLLLVSRLPKGAPPKLGSQAAKKKWAEMALSAVRKNPQEPAQTRGSRQKKANPEGLVFPLLVADG